MCLYLPGGRGIGPLHRLYGTLLPLHYCEALRGVYHVGQACEIELGACVWCMVRGLQRTHYTSTPTYTQSPLAGLLRPPQTSRTPPPPPQLSRRLATARSRPHLLVDKASLLAPLEFCHVYETTASPRVHTRTLWSAGTSAPKLSARVTN